MDIPRKNPPAPRIPLPERGTGRCAAIGLLVPFQPMLTVDPTTVQWCTPGSGFAELRKRVQEAGLFKTQPFYYVGQTLWCVCLFAAFFAMMALTKSLEAHLLAAVFLSFFFGQISLLGHDAGHQQIAGGGLLGRFVSQATGFLVGISPLSWTTRHNTHHANPNREDVDPDIHFPFLAYSEKQVLERSGTLARFIMCNQAILYYPILTLTAVSLRKTDIAFLRQRSIKETWVDWGIFALHFAAYFTLLFLLMPWRHVLLFVPIHYITWGLYMGFIFAPNHKGMKIIRTDQKIDFVREQVLTARNIRPGFFTDLLYGGLNYQIEHHLFPVMPRRNLKYARPIVQDYCRSNGIPYHESGLLQSYREILEHMGDIARFAQSTVVPTLL